MVGFTSILDKEESTYKNSRQNPVFLSDLNLNQVIEHIRFLWIEDVTPFFSYFPENEACENYRREVFGDIKKQAINEALFRFVEEMKKWSKAISEKDRVEMKLQKSVWQLWEIYHYCHAFEMLYEECSKENVQSEGFQTFLKYLEEYLTKDSVLAMKNRCYELAEKLNAIHLTVRLENDRIVVTQEEAESCYESFLKGAFGEGMEKFRSPFASHSNMTDLEKELFQMIYKKNSALFEELQHFSENYIQYGDDVLLRFKKEIGFYLSFYKFEKMMEKEGFVFSVPKVDETKEMQATGLFDLALAYVNSKQGKPVVSNDMIYHEGEHFFVVTGPNQGGKTTFARSLGQLVYFTKMGLDVPAAFANVHYFKDILSHFSVEESIETGHGKLKEELVRLSPMMKENAENVFLIINELFATAANYDACVMGRRVLERFQKQHCRGVYVTHLKELSEMDHMVSLCAQVEEIEVPTDDNANSGQNGKTKMKVKHVRKYKMIREQADDKGYADDLVEKHRLSYGQICERIERNRKDAKKGRD